MGTSNYSDEFKRDAVHQITVRGYPVREVSRHLLSASPEAPDRLEATDLMPHARARRIAVRIRRPGYAARFPFEFTARSGLASGGEAELSKIVNGHGN